MSSIEAPAASDVITGLIAAALYTATYLSFLRILRYPRNWCPISKTEVLTTALLAALTVAQVSLSDSGLDFASLAISAGFIGVASFIIAAPAIAFRPANRVVEFLAKHAERAGLLLLGPAFIAGLAVPNFKLQAMLAVAMAIELSWLLRQQYWARRPRELYSLNDSDLSALKTQAKGNLKAFRLSHSIRELVLSEGAVRWSGCGKSVPPCPFNFYVNRLGLNTAPCCREHLRSICHYVAACLNEMGAVHWLEGGSLLGAVRENGALLEWEDDIDISVLLDAEMPWHKLAAGLAERCERDGYFIDLFKNYNLISVSFDPPKSWPFRWERYRLRGEIRVDIALYQRAVSQGESVLERRSHKGDMPATDSGGYGLPEGIVLPTSTIKFLGGEFACPNESDAYLRVLYGDFEKVEYTYVDAAAVENRRRAELSGAYKIH